MRREPVLLIAGLLVAIAQAVLLGVGDDSINSLQDAVQIAIPLVLAFFARARVRPIP